MNKTLYMSHLAINLLKDANRLKSHIKPIKNHFSSMNDETCQTINLIISNITLAAVSYSPPLALIECMCDVGDWIASKKKLLRPAPDFLIIYTFRWRKEEV